MGDNGRLFGSVTNATIADELQKAGIIVERKKIEVPDHTIKAQGKLQGQDPPVRQSGSHPVRRRQSEGKRGKTRRRGPRRKRDLTAGLPWHPAI
jgi:hypothetical protein